MDLKSALEMVRHGWQFTQTAYPEMPESKQGVDGGWPVFAIKHTLFHMSKAVGAIANFCEQHDHGKCPNVDLKEEALKQVVNSLRLCDLLGLSAEDIERHLTNQFDRREKR